MLEPELLLEWEDFFVLEWSYFGVILLAYPFHIFSYYFRYSLQCSLLFVGQFYDETDVEGCCLVFVIESGVSIISFFNCFEVGLVDLGIGL